VIYQIASFELGDDAAEDPPPANKNRPDHVLGQKWFATCTHRGMRYQTLRLIHIVCLSLAANLLAANAHAQNIDDAVAHAGIGVGISHYNPSSDQGNPSQGVVAMFRWHSFSSGWGPTVGLDFHSTDFDQTLGGLNAPLGTFRMRALLGGYGYTKHVRRFTASANMTGGYAFNNFNVDEDAGQTFSKSGVSLVGVHVDNSWVLKPYVAAWYDVQSHVGVGVSVAYLVARPEQTITTAAGIQQQRLKTDALELSAGVTFGLWKKKP
jgi:hypothetical protein